MSSRPQLHQHPRLAHSILSSTGNAIGMYPLAAGEKATQTLLLHRFGRRFLLNNVLARATISFQLVTHHFFRHHFAGERSRSSCRSSPPCCRSGSTRVPRQGAIVRVAGPSAIEYGQPTCRPESATAAVHFGSGGAGSRQERTEADLGHLSNSTSGRDAATGKSPLLDT